MTPWPSSRRSLFRFEDSTLPEKIRFDNHFRLVVSAIALAIGAVLESLNLFTSFKTLAAVWMIYTVPYVLVWCGLRHLPALRLVYFFLSAIDFAAITFVVHITGGPKSPFFYLYPIPFLIHALYFDFPMMVFDAVASLAAYTGLLFFERHMLPSQELAFGFGQVSFLGVIIAVALFTALRFRRKDRSVGRAVAALQGTVTFLEGLNRIPPGLSSREVHQAMQEHLENVLKPFDVFCRLWILNNGWKTLEGVGEHAALRPGSPNHLPVLACPAFALRRPFHYSQWGGQPCSSEQFNYVQHSCLPIQIENDCYGVLFLGSYAPRPWAAEDIQFFGTLAQSVALTLQRHALLERLQDKIAELNFSFEVGATSLATFVGSTQSIDETTVRILDGVLSILKVDRASLMLWNAQQEVLQTQWVRGGDFKIHSPLRLKMGQGMAGWALKTGQPFWAEYATGDPHYLPSAQPIRSLLCVPVFTIDREPLGVINAVTTQVPRAFTPKEIEFLTTFGRQAALAIENAQLHHRARANIDQLSELNTMKSQFLSLVSHDLRGPLTGIRGFCEVLRQKELTTDQMELLNQMERQVELQERMVDDLLDLAKMEKGQFSIQPARTAMRPLIQEEVDKSRLEARERQIHLSLEWHGEESLEAMVDSDRIRQVLWNLIHNALKFTPEDGRVQVRVHPSETTVSIEIEDTGVGLSPETQAKVFEKFFQVSPGGSKGARGLGLGLAICKEIVAAHGGTISAESPGLGLGTTMRIVLPRYTPLSQQSPKLAA